MAKAVVIGGSGHIGTYLVPRLVEAGYEVVNVSRGAREPYTTNGLWKWVENVVVDRAADEKEGRFGTRIRELGGDVVLDMICFTLDSARQLVEALDGHVGHFLHTGTIWVHGHSTVVPATELSPRHPVGTYGTQKAAIEAYLLDRAGRNGFPATVLHPGHIVGPGWVPLNPAGNFNPAVFTSLARGEPLALPNFGLETVHHVHADDVAQMFMRALASRSNALGEAFHTVSPAAVSLRGYAEAVAAWFGREASLEFLPFEQWRERQRLEDAQATLEHISRSPNASIEKARRLLDYRPRYTSLEAVREALQWLIAHDMVSVN
jgi:nucleoside-diphosphate-sugar epimerase